MPAASAGEPGRTWATTAPFTLSSSESCWRRLGVSGASARPTPSCCAGGLALATCSEGIVPTVTSSDWCAPSRMMSSLAVSPGFTSATATARSRGVATLRVSTAWITSPGFSPALAAGESVETEAISAPDASPLPRLRAAAMVGFTGCVSTPRKPRVTWPVFSRSATTLLTMLDGMAKPMPMLPPEGDRMAVLMPTTRPSWVNSGPPELPWLMGASICRKLS